RLACSGALEDGSHEVAARRAAQPRGTYDGVAGPELGLTAQFGSSVCGERVGGVPLDVGAGRTPVKDVVGRDVHDTSAGEPRSFDHVAGAEGVDSEGAVGNVELVAAESDHVVAVEHVEQRVPEGAARPGDEKAA